MKKFGTISGVTANWNQWKLGPPIPKSPRNYDS